MCTLLLQHRPGTEHPLLIAANRDEHLARPAEGPALRLDGPIPFLAPRDLEAGGTWLGLNAHGLFVAITNRAGPPPAPEKISRGALVVQALGQPDAAAARAAFSALNPDDYNGFHLLHADAREASLTWSDGTVLHQEILAPGVVHAITERSFTPDAADRAAVGLAAWPKGRTPELPELEALLALHAPADAPHPLHAPCIHLQGVDYGTRSSCVLRLSRSVAHSSWRWAEGPPCRTPFQSLSGALEALAEASPARPPDR